MKRVCPHCGKALDGVKRLTLSMPAELVHWLRQYAKTQGMSVSAVVAEAIRLRRDAEQVAA